MGEFGRGQGLDDAIISDSFWTASTWSTAPAAASRDCSNVVSFALEMIGDQI
jgi:hypothetical protein